MTVLCPKCGWNTLRFAKGNENVRSYVYCERVGCDYMKDKADV
jgi:hypothetical protein